MKLIESHNFQLSSAEAAVHHLNSHNRYQPSSPIAGLVGAGDNLSSIFSTDINGTPRDAAWDIGAYRLPTDGDVIAPASPNAPVVLPDP